MTSGKEKIYRVKPFAPGDVIIDRFTVLKLLHASDNGGVYLVKAADRPDEKIVLKIIQISASENLELTEARFKNEIFATYNIKHPNVIRSYEYFQVGDHIGFTMEYLPGGDLADLLQLGEPLPVVQIVDLLKQILPGLHAIHSAGIIHRDLKPENILFTRNGEVKISDFGTVRIGATLSENGGISGTLRYLSPEYLRDGTLDPRSDIYSLGILAYEIATCDPPFKGPTPNAALEERTAGLLAPPNEIRKDFPKGLSAFIMKALSVVPDDRFQSAAEMLDTLELVLQDPRCGVVLPTFSPADGFPEEQEEVYEDEFEELDDEEFEEEEPIAAREQSSTAELQRASSDAIERESSDRKIDFVEELSEEQPQSEMPAELDEPIFEDQYTGSRNAQELPATVHLKRVKRDGSDLSNEEAVEAAMAQAEEVKKEKAGRSGRELAATVQLQRVAEDGKEMSFEEAVDATEAQAREVKREIDQGEEPEVIEAVPLTKGRKKLAKTVEIEQVRTPLSAPALSRSAVHRERSISAIALRSAVVSGILGLVLTGILKFGDRSLTSTDLALNVKKPETAEKNTQKSAETGEVKNLESKSVTTDELKLRGPEKRDMLISRANKQLLEIESALKHYTKLQSPVEPSSSEISSVLGDDLSKADVRDAVPAPASTWNVLYLKAKQQIKVATALQRLRGLGLTASVRELNNSEYRYLILLGPFDEREKAEVLFKRLRNSVLNNKHLEIIESEE